MGTKLLYMGKDSKHDEDVYNVNFVSFFLEKWVIDVFRVWDLLLEISDYQASTANKYLSASHHEQKNKKTTSQIRFLAVTIKPQIKLVLWHSLYK